jgi:hypothetical protein
MDMLSGLLAAAGSGAASPSDRPSGGGSDLLSLGSSLLGQLMKQK